MNARIQTLANDLRDKVTDLDQKVSRMAFLDTLVLVKSMIADLTELWNIVQMEPQCRHDTDALLAMTAEIMRTTRTLIVHDEKGEAMLFGNAELINTPWLPQPKTPASPTNVQRSAKPLQLKETK